MPESNRATSATLPHMPVSVRQNTLKYESHPRVLVLRRFEPAFLAVRGLVTVSSYVTCIRSRYRRPRKAITLPSQTAADIQISFMQTHIEVLRRWEPRLFRTIQSQHFNMSTIP